MIAPLLAATAVAYAGCLRIANLDVDGNPAVATHVGALGKTQLADLVEPHLAAALPETG